MSDKYEADADASVKLSQHDDDLAAAYMKGFENGRAIGEQRTKEHICLWMREEGLITSSRAAEILGKSVSEIIEMSHREQETCEYTPTLTKSGAVNLWVGACGEGIEQWHSKYCGGCGRRIVEKEAK